LQASEKPIPRVACMMLLPWCRAKTSMNSSGQLPVVLAAVDAVPLCLGLLVYFAPRRTEKQRNSH
jgi:hypothetical protein